MMVVQLCIFLIHLQVLDILMTHKNDVFYPPQPMTMKTIGALKLATSCTGIKFTPISGSFTDSTVRCYGLRDNTQGR